MPQATHAYITHTGVTLTDPAQIALWRLLRPVVGTHDKDMRPVAHDKVVGEAA